MVFRILAQAGPSSRQSLSQDSCNAFQSAWCRNLNTSRCRTGCSTRAFSCTARTFQYTEPNVGKDKVKGETHYDTLGITRGASRMEIKAAYFRLSKRYHPDVRRSAVRRESTSQSQDAGVRDAAEKEADKRATERFHEVNAAYKVLSDDRQRRAYDRTILSPLFSSSHLHRSHGHVYSHTPGSSHTHSYVYEMHRGRKRGATYAWEGASGPRGYTGWKQYAHSGPGHAHPFASAGAGRHYDPTSAFSQNQSAAGTQSQPRAGTESKGTKPVDRVLTGRALRVEEERLEHDRLVRESDVARFFRALGIVFVISLIGSLANH